MTKTIKQCRTCHLAKDVKQNTWLYTPLPVPHEPWQDLSMNFVLGFPKTVREHDYIFIVVDRFFKMAHHIPSRSTIYASNVPSLFFKEVVRLLGVPKSIKFTSYFWKAFSGYLWVNNYSFLAPVTRRGMARSKW